MSHSTKEPLIAGQEAAEENETDPSIVISETEALEDWLRWETKREIAAAWKAQRRLARAGITEKDDNGDDQKRTGAYRKGAESNKKRKNADTNSSHGSPTEAADALTAKKSQSDQ